MLSPTPTVSRAGSASRGLTRALAFIVDACGAEAMSRRAAQALGLMPSIRWAELDSPWTSGADLLTIQLTDAGRSLTVAVTDPENDAFIAELGDLLGVIATMVRREYAIEVLAAQARTDSLTGLWNRRAFDELMDQALSRAARAGEQVAVLLCDVDHFKQINDQFGHSAGDRALISLADAIRSVTRPSDVAARIGGDEIAILLSGCDADGAVCAAERLRAAITAGHDEDTPPLTISMGIASVEMIDSPGPNATSRASLLRLADEAMYLAKKAGRDQVIAHPGAANSRAA